MSDDFLKAATKEIQDELDEIQKILEICKNDNDISYKAKDLEKHLHKIKGLAPMMGEINIGEIAKMSDRILKHVILNGPVNDTLNYLTESNGVMEAILWKQYKENIFYYKEKIKKTFSNVLKN